MENTITKQYSEELLYDLLLKYGISDRVIKNYKRQYMYEIKDMADIFNSNDLADQKLAITLLSLLSQDQSEGVVNFYKKEKKISANPDLSEENIKQLLIECWRDRVFLSFALSLCEDIKAELKKKEPNKKIQNKFPGRSQKTSQIRNITLKYAESKDNSFSNVFFEDHDISYNNISGSLYFVIENKKQIYLEFVFKEYQEIIPYGLKIIIENKHEIIIPFDRNIYRNKETKQTIIKSDVKEIDCLDELGSTYLIEFLLPENI